jgi:pyruvate,water dikinase
MYESMSQARPRARTPGRSGTRPAPPRRAGEALARLVLGALAGCGGEAVDAPAPRVWTCAHTGPEVPESLSELGCRADFLALASPPLDASIPGARSVKTIVDRVDDGALHFQDTARFPIHWDFASARLSGMGLPVVPMRAGFNATEYSSSARRFLLGAVTHYEGPDLYVYEIAPYDTASAEMIEQAYSTIAAHSWFGEQLYFHPSSASVELEARRLPATVKQIDTQRLYAGVRYQPLNVAESVGRLRFVDAEAIETSYLSFRDIVVLRSAPNDISVVTGIVTEEFQTPLSHLNVLSRNRGTPNMSLRGAFDDAELRALEGRWVRLRVGALDYAIEAVDTETADAWWAANKPAEVRVPGLDLDAVELADIETLVDTSSGAVGPRIKAATRAYGGKAAHYAVLARIEGVPVPPAFAVPVFYYEQFMRQNGFDLEVEAMLADPEFRDDPEVRDTRLAALRAAMEAAPVDPDFVTALEARLRRDFPGVRMRFRSSTNAEDLDGFTGAGLYTSKSGELDSAEDPILDAVRKVWASVWFFRAFEERSYRSIDHRAVGMALLVHRSFPAEEANGVALTDNPYDPSGLEPAFYVNVQLGDTSVVRPPAGVTTDELLYYHDRADQPVTYLSRSNLPAPGTSVLSRAQLFELGEALSRIREYFAPIYGVEGGWWAMDVEFKFDGEPGETPRLFVKQARPYR